MKLNHSAVSIAVSEGNISFTNDPEEVGEILASGKGELRVGPNVALTLEPKIVKRKVAGKSYDAIVGYTIVVTSKK